LLKDSNSPLSPAILLLLKGSTLNPASKAPFTVETIVHMFGTPSMY